MAKDFNEFPVEKKSGGRIMSIGAGLVTQYSSEIDGYFIMKYGCMPSSIDFSNTDDGDDNEDAPYTEIPETSKGKYYLNLSKLLPLLAENAIEYEILGESYHLSNDGLGYKLKEIYLCFPQYEAVAYFRSELVGSSQFVVMPSLLSNDETYKEKLKTIHMLAQQTKELIERRKRFIYLLDKHGYPTKIKFDFKENINLAEQYNDDFLEMNDRISNWIVDEENNGLIILHGLKGTGKSTYIRYLLDNFYKEKDFVFVTKDGINNITSNGISNLISVFQDKVVIFEDCEQVLKERSSASSDSFVPLLLNLTDGLLSDVCKCKFILTFNCPISQIDDALTRKGRCFCNYEFTKLCKEKTVNLLYKLNKIHAQDEEPSEGMAINEIFFFNEKKYEKSRKKIGFGH